MPNNLTDTEIKKALEICASEHLGCEDGCPLKEMNCRFEMPKLALDLINRQDFKIHLLEKQVNEIQNANLIDFNATVGNYKAENKSLKAEIEKWQGGYMTQKQEIANLVVELKAMRGAANSYKAEVERLSGDLIIERTRRENAVNAYHEAKAEAYKEFAEKLKEIATSTFWETDAYVGVEQINNLLNELVGDENGN